MNSGVKVAIDGLSFGGAGVGTITQADDDTMVGMRAFVPYTAPGDVAVCDLMIRKKKYAECALRELVSPSTHRIEPLCRLFGECGGCDFQHIDYDTQLIEKRRMLLASIQSGGMGGSIAELVAEVEGSAPYGYRRRTSLHVDGEGKVGFRRRFSHEVVGLHDCPILETGLRERLPQIRELVAAIGEGASRVELTYIGGEVFAVVHVKEREISPNERARLLIQAQRFGDEGFRSIRIVVGGKESIGCGEEIALEAFEAPVRVSYSLPPSAFSQVNCAVNRKLVSCVLDLISEGECVLDLYAGAGNFALPLAARGSGVVAVEKDSRLVDAGEASKSLNNLKGSLRFECSSVERFFKINERNRSTYDTIIADPPRSGLGDLCRLLPKSRRLLLVNCHVPSFIRDVKNLIASGWQVMAIKPFDMFAQTTYVEILTVMERR